MPRASVCTRKFTGTREDERGQLNSPECNAQRRRLITQLIFHAVRTSVVPIEDRVKLYCRIQLRKARQNERGDRLASSKVVILYPFNTVVKKLFLPRYRASLTRDCRHGAKSVR